MKRILLFGIFCAFGCTISAQKAEVTVEKPGTLSSLLTPAQISGTKHLVVKGKLGGADISLIRLMAGRNMKGGYAAGQLRQVDMRDVSFVSDGVPYYTDNRGNHTVTSPHCFPAYIFDACHLEKIVLPAATDTIGRNALSNTLLKRVDLPEDVTISFGAFYGDSLLTHVSFPRAVNDIYPSAFAGTAIRRLRINDMRYSAMGAFENMPELVSAEINGDIIHMDGEPFRHCPQLREVHIKGNLLSSGGFAFARNCPQLERVVFDGNILNTGFKSVVECPRLSAPELRGYLGAGSQKDFLPAVGDKMPATAVASLVATMDKYGKKMASQSAAGSMRGFLSNCLAHSYYYGACISAVQGNPKAALDMLECALDFESFSPGNMLLEMNLKSLHNDARFLKMVERVNHREQQLREAAYNASKLKVLRECGPYKTDEAFGPDFTYQSPDAEELREVRSYFNLDSIAGNGDEISRMKRIMTWLHDNIRHDGSNGYPENTPRRVVDLFKACKAQNRGLNCRGLAMCLSELYLAMGWPARFITCQPKGYKTDPDCHVINIVWSRQLNKWVWMDPSFDAYVTDEKGVLLHPGEVRERLIDGRELVLNETANWNHQEKQTKEGYLEKYMAKNLYFLSAWTHACVGTEDGSGRGGAYIYLLPVGFEIDNQDSVSHNPEYFWQAPKGL